MKKILALLTLILLPFVAFGQEVNIKGLNYSINDTTRTACVVRQNWRTISGTVTIPSTILYEGNEYAVTSISEGAFTNCQGLKSVVIGNSVKTIGKRAFSHCTRFTSVTIPNSVENIDDFAFVNCTKLSNVTIPNSVRRIGFKAFACCSSMTSINIPNSVETIGWWAFELCENLKSIHVKRTFPEAYNCDLSAFYNTPRNCTLHVPSGCANIYRNTSPWNIFKHIKE